MLTFKLDPQTCPGIPPNLIKVLVTSCNLIKMGDLTTRSNLIKFRGPPGAGGGGNMANTNK